MSKTKAERLMLDKLFAPAGVVAGRGTTLYSNEGEIIAFVSLMADVYETLPARTLSLSRLKEDCFSIDENGVNVGRLDIFDKAITPDKAFARAIEHIERRLRAEGWTESAA